MSAPLDIRTAFFLLGVLSIAGALGVYASLRQRMRQRHRTWVWAGVFYGLGMGLIALRGRAPDVASFEGTHVLLLSAMLMQVSALRAETGQGWSLARLAVVVAGSTAIYTTLSAIERGLGYSYNVLAFAIATLMLVVAAVGLWLRIRLVAALVIAAGYILVIGGLLARIFDLLPASGRGGPFDTSFAQAVLMVTGLFSVILGNLGYLGLQFLRLASEQVAVERQSAAEAERFRQIRERELVLHDLIEERNQLIQRIARSETASDLALFATSLPHELSQPLCASRLSLESLRTVLERQGDPMLLPVVRAIEASNERVLDLLQQLRILLRSQESCDREVVDLRPLIQRTVPILEGSFREHDIRLIATLPARPFDVLASATQLQQLLLILCTHTLDELRRQPAGEGGLQVRVALEADAHEVRLRVEDSGQRSGADLRRQFEPKARRGIRLQEESGDRRGLGLVVARRVAEAHLGRLEIRESWMGGAAYVVTLPTAQAAAELAASAPAIRPPPTQTSPS